MKKNNALIFGIISGIILCINMMYMVNLCYSNADFESNDLVAYAAMIIVMTLIFFGIKNVRNKELGGYITFGKAFKTGAYIAFVGSSIYVVVWLFYYYLFVPDYMDKYIPHVLKSIKPDELAAKTKEMEKFKEMYKSTFFVIVVTYAEVFPAGVLVALLSAFMLNKKQVLIVEKGSK